MLPIIISCYTKDTIYEEEIKDLTLSCINLNLNYDFEAFTSLGSWEKNCCFKPKYILKKLLEYKKTILWVDADAIIIQKPIFSDNYKKTDIAFCPKYEKKKIISLHSGTLLINYTKDAISLLKNWDEECIKALTKKKDEEIWDQRCLYDLIFKKTFPVKFSTLSPKYCYIFGRKYSDEIKNDIFILHSQASRLAKTFINQNIETPLFLKNLPSFELKKFRY